MVYPLISPQLYRFLFALKKERIFLWWKLRFIADGVCIHLDKNLARVLVILMSVEQYLSLIIAKVSSFYINYLEEMVTMMLSLGFGSCKESWTQLILLFLQGFWVLCVLHMEAAIAQRVQYPSWIDCRKFEGKPLGSLRYSQRVKEDKKFRGLIALAHLQPDRRNDQRRSVSSEVSCSDNNSSGFSESIWIAFECLQ